MKWRGRQASRNVQDRRGSGGGMRIPGGRMGGGLGCGGLIIILIVILLGGDPTMLLQQQTQQAPSTEYRQTPGQERADDELAQFVKVVLKDTEDVWNKLYPDATGRPYQEPTLVLFDGQVQSACGFASSATGPFYCPADQQLYIDLSFYRDLSERFGAPGDFAMAYVVAHEVAHHIQNLLGYTRQVQSQKGRIPEREYNQLSVRLELQADFLAGVWAHHVEKAGYLEGGDIQEAMNAANAIGDDRIQKQARGYVVPDSFTHGTSEQRMRWFQKGYQTGDIRQGDTFSEQNL
ncbi:MAG: metalloprotease [Flavobacteriales bacterium]|nr:metalloprotease [Flavobacteriales bacterium]